MRHSFSLAVWPLAAQALQTVQQLDDNQFLQRDGISRYPITVSGGAPVKGLHKRQNEASLTSQNLGFFYTIDIEIGSPPQTVSVNFDTGSSELWVNPVCSKSNDVAFCETFGRYNESRTFVDAKASGGVVYGTGFVDFNYGYDHIKIGTAKIKQQLFGVATDSEFASVGILGAGPSLDGWTSPYPLVIDTMAQQGIIKSRAFSLDLRNLGSSRGSVVYGGIDTKKFSGPLEKRPIIPAAESPDGFTRYWIYLDGISITEEDGSNLTVFDQPNGQPVLLDSGYTLSALPGPLFNKILEAFPSATAEPNSDEYFVDCNITKSRGSIGFKFGKTIIQVPYNDFIWHQEDGRCKLGVTRDDGFPVLGDTFLRSAYVVFDWDNQNVHLANNEDCGSELIPIGKGVDAVPSVTGACGAPTSTSSIKLPLMTAPVEIAPLLSIGSLVKGILGAIGGNGHGESTSPSTNSSRPLSGYSSSITLSNSNSTLSRNSSSVLLSNSNSTLFRNVSSILLSNGNSTLSRNSSSILLSNSNSTLFRNASSILLSNSNSTLLSNSNSTLSGNSSNILLSNSNSTLFRNSSNTLLDDSTADATLTSTLTMTQSQTVTLCPPTVTNCRLGHEITEPVSSSTTFGPDKGSNSTLAPELPPTSQFDETTATYTIPRTYTCSKGLASCASQPSVHVITVSPIVTQTAPVVIPHFTTTTDESTSTPVPTHPSALSSLPEATSTAAPTTSSSAAVKPAPTDGLVTTISPCSTCSSVLEFVPVPTQGNDDSSVLVAGASQFGAPSMVLLAGALVAALL